MLSKVIVALCLVALSGFLMLKFQNPQEKIPTIGILQTASHPALDRVREGFEARLTMLLEGEVRFVEQNAEGSLAQAKSIAESFHAQQHITAILAIGTPAVQAAARAEKKKPLFITAVSDPKALGVLGSNVCGTTDRVDTEAQADMILKLVPEVKSVSILFNQAENNSQIMVAKMKQSLQKRGLEPIAFGLNAENEIPQMVAAAARKGEVLLIPADNMMASAISLVAREALKMKRPLIASDILLVAKGALAAQGADYGHLGRETAEIAHLVVTKDHRPDELGIRDPTQVTLVVNREVLKTLKLPVPEQPGIVFVGGDHEP